ncbi:MAG: hypothetical protein ACR2IV_24075 [Bryobacteraceae bacterium]
MRPVLIFVCALVICAPTLSAQQLQPPLIDIPPQTNTREDTTTNPVTLAQPLEPGLRNYVNFYAFGNGVYDSTFPIDERGQFNNPTADHGAWGYEVGGGLTAYHDLNLGSLSLSYRGGYRNYQSSIYPSGTDQNLSLYFRNLLNRRWAFSFSQAAGMFLNGGAYFSLRPSQSNLLELNPYTQNTKFLSSSLTLSYQRSVRLSYELGGDFFLTRYGGAAPFGSTGGTGSASLLYRVTRRTTVSGTLSHGYNTYQGHAGQSYSDSLYATLSHDFSLRWHGGISAGINRVHSSGTVLLPLVLLTDSSIVDVYVPGPYNQTTAFPYLQASLTRAWKHSQFTVNAGQNVNPGNGFLLASRNDFGNGFYSYGRQKWNVGFGGNYSRLTSVSNAAGSYSSLSFSGSLGYSLVQHVGLNLRYDYADYGSFGPIGGRIDNRVTFGFLVSSKNVPATLF